MSKTTVVLFRMVLILCGVVCSFPVLTGFGNNQDIPVDTKLDVIVSGMGLLMFWAASTLVSTSGDK